MHKRRKDSSRFPINFWKSQHSYVYCSSSFRDLTLTDTCTSGTSACVEGAVAECIDERWVGPVGTPCSDSEQCFAVPVDSPVCPHSVVPLQPHPHSHISTDRRRDQASLHGRANGCIPHYGCGCNRRCVRWSRLDLSHFRSIDLLSFL